MSMTQSPKAIDWWYDGKKPWSWHPKLAEGALGKAKAILHVNDEECRVRFHSSHNCGFVELAVLVVEWWMTEELVVIASLNKTIFKLRCCYPWMIKGNDLDEHFNQQDYIVYHVDQWQVGGTRGGRRRRQQRNHEPKSNSELRTPPPMLKSSSQPLPLLENTDVKDFYAYSYAEI